MGDLSTVLFLIGLLGAACGGFAGYQRGRLVEGVLWGLCAGPLGALIVYSFTEDLRQPPCPYCRGRISKRAVRCRHCAANLNQQAAAPQKTPRPQAVAVK